jgi:hypothetical protein
MIKALYTGPPLEINFMNDYLYIKDFIIIDNTLSKRAIIKEYKKNGFDLIYKEVIREFQFCGYTYNIQALLIFMNLKTLQQIKFYTKTKLDDQLQPFIKLDIYNCQVIVVDNNTYRLSDHYTKYLNKESKPKILLIS